MQRLVKASRKKFVTNYNNGTRLERDLLVTHLTFKNEARITANWCHLMSKTTASRLILIGAIWQLLVSLLFLGVGVGILILPSFLVETFNFIAWLLTTFFPSLAYLLGFITILIGGFFVFAGTLILIFSILWLWWRRNPEAHVTGLIITGLLGAIFGGLIPGLLIIIGGATAD